MLKKICECSNCGKGDDVLEIQRRLREATTAAVQSVAADDPNAQRDAVAKAVRAVAWWVVEGRRLDQGPSTGLIEIGTGVSAAESHACGRKCLREVLARFIARFDENAENPIVPPYQFDVKPFV